MANHLFVIAFTCLGLLLSTPVQGTNFFAPPGSLYLLKARRALTLHESVCVNGCSSSHQTMIREHVQMSVTLAEIPVFNQLTV